MKHSFFLLIFLLSVANLIAQKESKNFKKGHEHQMNQDYEKAITLYTKDLNSKGEKFIGSYANRGLCYYITKQYQKCIDDLLIVDKSHPGNARTNEWIGLSYNFIHDYSNAAIHLQKAIDLGHENAKGIYGQLGTSYYFSGDNVMAKKYLEMALNLNPSNDFVLNNLAWANLDTEPETSCKLFHRAYDADSLNVPNINNLGYSHLLCGDLEIAFNYFKKAEKLDATNSFIFRNYALYYMYKEDKENACLNLQKAKDLRIIEDYGKSYTVELETYCAK
jgi:tetratricopeptide (TPR) repeat protein